MFTLYIYNVEHRILGQHTEHYTGKHRNTLMHLDDSLYSRTAIDMFAGIAGHPPMKLYSLL